MVKPWEEETTVLKVCRVGREISADWCVIQKWRTESKVFAKTILWNHGQGLKSHFVRIEEDTDGRNVPCFPFVPGRPGHTSSPNPAQLSHGPLQARTDCQT